MKRFFALGIVCMSLFACQSTTQTTSGTDYLARYDARNQPEGSGDIEDALRRIASVEPTLTFPARIGLARIDGGRLSGIPAEEAEAWRAIGARLGSSYGEFVPVSPMVASMAASGVGGVTDGVRQGTVNQIRMGAARQHLDAVLVYETYSKTSTKSNLLSMGDLTIIGGYVLPSKSSQAEGVATAMLIDVMQGYPYGTVSTAVDKESSLSSRWGWGSDDKQDMGEAVRTRAAVKLSGEVEQMIRTLRVQLERKESL